MSEKPKTSATIKIVFDLKGIKRVVSKLKETVKITDIRRLSGDCEHLLKAEIISIEQINPLIEEKI